MSAIFIVLCIFSSVAKWIVENRGNGAVTLRSYSDQKKYINMEQSKLGVGVRRTLQYLFITFDLQMILACFMEYFGVYVSAILYMLTSPHLANLKLLF